MSDLGSWRTTASLAAITVIVSLLALLSGALPWAAVQGGFIPARLSDPIIAGQDFAVPVWVTPLTATLIHGGIAHLLLNLVILLFCGRQVEHALGSGAMLLLYIVGAYAGAAGHWIFGSTSPMPMIGASGAISAVVAAYALLFGESRARAFGPFSADMVHVAWLAAAWIGIQLLMSIAGVGGIIVAIGAHIGGFVAGLVIARPLLFWRYRHA